MRRSQLNAVLDALPHPTNTPTPHKTHRPHDRTQDHSRHWMTPADVDAAQPRGPVICDVFTFAILGPHHLVNVVADFVEKDLAEEHRPQEAEIQNPHGRAGNNPIDKQFYPRGLSLPRLMVESRCLGVSDLPAETTRPLTLARTRQCPRVGQHDLSESNEVLRWNGGKQILRHRASIKRGRVVSIGLNDFRHRGSGYSGRQLEGTASNNALQLTSGGLLAAASRPPSSMRRSQLNAVFGER